MHKKTITKMLIYTYIMIFDYCQTLPLLLLLSHDLWLEIQCGCLG